MSLLWLKLQLKATTNLIPTKVEGYYFVVVVNSPFGHNRGIRKLLGWTALLVVWFSDDETDECWRSKYLLSNDEVNTY
jgi:hypothetical protein